MIRMENVRKELPEASLIAAKHKLDNLFLIIDYNKIQALTTLKEGLPLFSLKKFNAFNFNTIEIKDGHNFNLISKNFKISKKISQPYL